MFCGTNLIFLYFNTSHVNVNLERLYLMQWLKRISIHLMLMLITIIFPFFIFKKDFNTSHVNVNPYN